MYPRPQDEEVHLYFTIPSLYFRVTDRCATKTTVFCHIKLQLNKYYKMLFKKNVTAMVSIIKDTTFT